MYRIKMTTTSGTVNYLGGEENIYSTKAEAQAVAKSARVVDKNCGIDYIKYRVEMVK